MDRIPGFHLALHQLVAFLDLEEHAAFPEEDRLVLLVVILQAQRMTGVDVNELADVAVGLRPVQLVAPRLLYSYWFVHTFLFRNGRLTVWTV